ncbi:MAG: hypothetical protein ACMXYB_02715 [Candidatus Woesearchaeota archaeon]
MKDSVDSTIQITSQRELEQYLENTIKNFLHIQNNLFDDLFQSISSIVSNTEILDELLYREQLYKEQLYIEQLLHKHSNSTSLSSSSSSSSSSSLDIKDSKILHSSKPSLIKRFSQKIDNEIFKFKHLVPLSIKSLFSSNDELSKEYLKDAIDRELLQLQEIITSLEFELLTFETSLYSIKNKITTFNTSISNSFVSTLISSHLKKLKTSYSKLNKLIIEYVKIFKEIFGSSQNLDIFFEKIYEEYHTIKLEVKDLKESSFKQVIDLESSLFEFFEHSHISDEEIRSLPKIKLQELKKGDIIVEYIEQEYPQMLGKVISFFLKTPIIHTSVVYKISKKKVFIFETSTLNGIFKSKILEFKPDKHIRYIILRANSQLNKNQCEIMDSFIDNHISTPYAPLKTTGLVYKKLVKEVRSKYYFVNSNFKNPISHKRGLFCSELVSKMYKEMGITITKIADDSLVSPFDVYNSKVLVKIGILQK